MPHEQWVWKNLEFEVSAATQKFNSRAPFGFWPKKTKTKQNKTTCSLQEFLGVPKESDLFICTALKTFRRKLEMCLVLDIIPENLQSKWMRQMYSSFTNVKPKPQITQKTHYRVRNSIYIPEPDLKPYLQISLSFNCTNLLYNLSHLQRLLNLTPEYKNWHSLKYNGRRNDAALCPVQIATAEILLKFTSTGVPLGQAPVPAKGN